MLRPSGGEVANLLPAGELASTDCERSEQADPTITVLYSEAWRALQRRYFRLEFLI